MIASTLDPKSLARVAIWARVFCAPSSRTGKWKSYYSWSGYNSQEWSRLIELASAVDRKTLSRLLGIFFVLMLCFCMILAALFVTALTFFKPPMPPSSSHVGLLIMTGAGIGSAIAMLVAFWVALDGAVRQGLIESLTAQAGDAELVAKMRRQHFRITGVAVVAAVLMLFTFLTFSETLRPFTDQWNWLLLSIAAVYWIAYLIQIFRRPRRIAPSNTAEHSGGC